MTAPGEQAHGLAVTADDQAVAVVLDLVRPARPRGRLGGQGRDAGLDKAICADAGGHGARVEPAGVWWNRQLAGRSTERPLPAPELWRYSRAAPRMYADARALPADPILIPYQMYADHRQSEGGDPEPPPSSDPDGGWRRSGGCAADVGRTVGEELTRLARANMADYIGPDDIVAPIRSLSRDQAAAAQERTVEHTEGSGDEAREVKKIKFRLADKLRTLELLGKHHLLFAERRIHEDGGIAERLAAAIAKPPHSEPCDRCGLYA
jgi:hypothetical protein